MHTSCMRSGLFALAHKLPHPFRCGLGGRDWALAAAVAPHGRGGAYLSGGAETPQGLGLGYWYPTKFQLLVWKRSGLF